METRRRNHPSSLQLAALALGKLKPEAMQVVRSHASQCPQCAQFLNKTPPTELTAIVRKAQAQRAAEQNTRAGGNSGTIPGIPAEGSASAGAGQAPVPRATYAPAGIPQELREQTKYRVLRLIDSGGMGSVYEAEHLRMHRRVAIKVINAEIVHNPDAMARFDREIHACASVDHPNIVRAYDAETFGSLQAIIMEFVAGQNLYDLLRDRGWLPVSEACRYVHQALLGLQHAHERKLVHRDLKPQNLILDGESGQVKILDFGLGKVRSENLQTRALTLTFTTMGTCEYMAPEQALDPAKADIRADIYSLGCTLYYLIAGVLPFEYDTYGKVLMAHQNETPRRLDELCPGTPRGLADLVACMLAKRPQDRPQTPGEAAEALAPFAAAAGERQPAQSRRRETQLDDDGFVVRPVRRRHASRGYGALAAAVAACAIGVGALAGRLSRDEGTTAAGASDSRSPLPAASGAEESAGQDSSPGQPGDSSAASLPSPASDVAGDAQDTPGAPTAPGQPLEFDQAVEVELADATNSGAGEAKGDEPPAAPRPPRSARAAVDEFAAAVTLPSRDSSNAAGESATVDLGRVSAATAAQLQLAIVQPAMMPVIGLEFYVTPATASAPPTWTIGLRSPATEERDALQPVSAADSDAADSEVADDPINEIVAQISAENGQLRFHWLPSEHGALADRLRNCILRFDMNGRQHDMKLRAEEGAFEMVLDLTTRTMLFELEGESLPDLDALCLKMESVDLPPELEPVLQPDDGVVQGKKKLLVQVESGNSQVELAFSLGTSKGKPVVMFQPRYRVGRSSQYLVIKEVDDVIQIMTDKYEEFVDAIDVATRDLPALNRSLDQALARVNPKRPDVRLQADIVNLRRQITKRQTSINLMNDKLDEYEATGPRFKEIAAMARQLDRTARFTFRVFLPLPNAGGVSFGVVKRRG